MHVDNSAGVQAVDLFFNGFFSHAWAEETADYADVTDNKTDTRLFRTKCFGSAMRPRIAFNGVATRQKAARGRARAPKAPRKNGSQNVLFAEFNHAQNRRFCALGRPIRVK